MKVSIHQPQYLPWLPYMLKLSESDLFILLDSVPFQKNGLQNRNHIKTQQGAKWITVPVKHSFGQLIHDVEINNETPWRHKHWSTLSQCYANAPYFKMYAQDLEAVYTKDWDRLAELNYCMLELFLGWFRIETKVVRSSSMKASGKGSDLILKLCQEAKATTYLSGIGGKNYLDEAAFSEAGIDLQYRPPVLPEPYPQQFSELGFMNDLSCLDIILNCGQEWINYIEKGARGHGH